jgi:carboxyl-terminal processing protease
MDDLEKLAKFEGYYDDAKPEFDALAKKLKHNVAKDLDYNKKAIKQLIENDLVTAYYYQGGGIQNSLRFDKQMKAAVSLLNNPTKYKNILQPASAEKTNKPAGSKKRDLRNAFVVR